MGIEFKHQVYIIQYLKTYEESYFIYMLPLYKSTQPQIILNQIPDIKLLYLKIQYVSLNDGTQNIKLTVTLFHLKCSKITSQ